MVYLFIFRSCTLVAVTRRLVVLSMILDRDTLREPATVTRSTWNFE